MKNSKTLDIGEVSLRSGLPVSTLRFYEEIGLIKSTGRNGLRRLFDGGVLELLEFIALGRQAGFSLKEIRPLFVSEGRPRIDRKLLTAKADELDKNIKRLTAVRAGLRHVAKCPASNHLECPNFQRLLRVAGKVQGRVRNR